MLSIYDLYDLHTIFTNIRFRSNYNLNESILIKVIGVLKYKQTDYAFNLFRTALNSIDSLDENLYRFVFTQNVYTYIPKFVKDENIQKILIDVCESLLKTIQEGNNEKITDLADCLHNLPIIIAENNLSVPKRYWKNEVKHYRNKWDESFLSEYKN